MKWSKRILIRCCCSVIRYSMKFVFSLLVLVKYSVWDFSINFFAISVSLRLPWDFQQHAKHLVNLSSFSQNAYSFRNIFFCCISWNSFFLVLTRLLFAKTTKIKGEHEVDNNWNSRTWSFFRLLVLLWFSNLKRHKINLKIHMMPNSKQKSRFF